jgi:hypothetical protein
LREGRASGRVSRGEIVVFSFQTAK